MKQTLFYLACLLTLAALLAGCTGFQAPKPAAASPTYTIVTVTRTTGPTATATISTPAVVTVGAPVTASPTPTNTPAAEQDAQTLRHPQICPGGQVVQLRQGDRQPLLPPGAGHYRPV